MESQAKFIPADEFEEIREAEETVTYRLPEMSEAAHECRSLTELARSGDGMRHVAIPRELGKRKPVVNAFLDAFDLIGGVPRLALWADSHPTDYYKLLARIIPGEVGQHITHDGKVQINHILPRSALDE